jgi:hypothetical protein
MKRLLIFLALIFCLAFFQKVKATHLAGGYITYTNVGQDSFMVKTVLYIDCSGYTNQLGALWVTCIPTSKRINTYYLQKPSPIDITATCDTVCNQCSDSNCVIPYGLEKYEVNTLVVLTSTSCTNIRFSLTTCCRSYKITTGIAAGSFWIEATLDRYLAPDNNSPQINYDPLMITCVDKDVTINLQALNLDKDSLGNDLDNFFYEFAYPKGSGGSNLSYTGNYDYDKPIFFWGFPNKNLPAPRGFHLDYYTSILTFRPKKIEQTAIAVKITEYRNGVKIGEVTHDFQFIVISCPNNEMPQISGPDYKRFCLTDTVRFEIGTYDPDLNDSLELEFQGNIPGSTFTYDSSQKNPTGYFTWIPDTAKLKANKYYNFIVKVKDNACPISGITFKNFGFQFYDIKPTDSIKITSNSLGCSRYQFSAQKWPDQNDSFKWLFYTGQNQIFNTKNLTKTFYSNGKYPFKLEINSWSNTCRSFYEDTIEITDAYEALKIDTLVVCQNDEVVVKAENYPADSNFEYTWSLEINGNTHYQYGQTFKKVFKNDKLLSIFVNDTVNSCSYSDQVYIKVIRYDEEVDAGQDVTICKSVDTFLLTGKPHFDSSYWTGNNVYKKDSQYYFVTNHANNEETFTLYYFPNELNCGIYDSIKITVLDDGIDPLKDKVNLCQTQKTYPLNSPYKNTIWTGQNVSNDKFKNPSMDTGKFEIYLFAGDVNCNVRDTQTIHVFPLQEVFASAKNPSYCQGDTIFLKADIQYPNQSLHSWWEKDKANGSFLSDSSNTKIGYIPDFEDFNRGNVSFVFKSKEIACPDKISTLFIPMFKNPKANFIADTTIGVIPLSICFEDFSKAENSYISKRFWKLSNQATSTDQKPCTTYDSAGFYDVFLLVENHVGCRDSIIKKDFIHAFSTVSMKMIEQGLTIFPNPFTSQILIKSEKSIQNIRLINFEGKIVLNTEAKENQIELSTENLPKGIYLLEIFFSDGSKASEVLCKE